MILFGASGHAKVIIDILLKSGAEVECLVDANPNLNELMGYQVIHQDSYQQNSEHEVILSIGSNKVRKKLAESLSVRFGRAIHPATSLAAEVAIEEGTVVMAGAVINTSTRVGKHCIINTSASVDHDCTIEDYVHISPNATLCGTIAVGEGTQVGAGAVVIPNLKIGKWATIGAGAVIIEDVPDYAVVVGNPGKVIKYNER